MDRSGPTRALRLLGALRALALYGARELRHRGWLSERGLEAIRRDLHLAGVPWPSQDEEWETTRRGGEFA